MQSHRSAFDRPARRLQAADDPRNVPVGPGAPHLQFALHGIRSIGGRDEDQGRRPAVLGLEIRAAVGVKGQAVLPDAQVCAPSLGHLKIARLCAGLDAGAVRNDRELVAVEEARQRKRAEFGLRLAFGKRRRQRRRLPRAAQPHDPQSAQRRAAVIVPVGFPDRDGQFLAGPQADGRERRKRRQVRRLAVAARAARHHVDPLVGPLAREHKRRRLHIIGLEHDPPHQRQVKRQDGGYPVHAAHEQVLPRKPERAEFDRHCR